MILELEAGHASGCVAFVAAWATNVDEAMGTGDVFCCWFGMVAGFRDDVDVVAVGDGTIL